MTRHEAAERYVTRVQELEGALRKIDETVQAHRDVSQQSQQEIGPLLDDVRRIIDAALGWPVPKEERLW